MAKYRRRSRLARKQESRSLRRAALFGLLTFIIALGLIFLGIPLLIRMAVFIGDLRGSSKPIESQDTVPPAPVRFQPFWEATNSAQIELQGFSEPGSSVEIFLDNTSLKKIVTEEDGTFSTGKIELSKGKNEIHAIATDNAGNQSQESEKILVEYDNTSPDLEITEPEDGAEISQEESKIIIKGQTEKGATLSINDRMIIVGSEGNFDYQVSLSEGENSFSIVSRDKAGNQSEKELTVTYSP